MAPPDRLRFLDGLRGLAALWVAVFHLEMSGQLQGLRRAVPTPLFRVVFDLGHLGVWIFFALSGFVMAMVVERRETDSAFVLDFLLRRIVRLALPYYASIVVGLGMLVLYAAAHGIAVAWPELGAVVAHLFFGQELLGKPQISIVYWTLCIEIQFYFAFGLLCWALHLLVLRLGLSPAEGLKLKAVGITLVTALSLAWPFGLTASALWRGGFAPFFFAFMGGVLARTLCSAGPAARGVVAAYCVLTAGATLATGHSGPLMAAITVGALGVAPSLPAFRRLLEGRPLLFCGTISYSLYLIHCYMNALVVSLVHHLMKPGLASSAVALALAVPASIAAAWLMWKFVELPAQALGRRITIGLHPRLA